MLHKLFTLAEDLQDRVPEYTLSLQTISIMHLKDYEEPHVFEIIVNPGAFFSSQRYLFKAENEESILHYKFLAIAIFFFLKVPILS